MTAFFVRTDRCTSGPFTGVELREAALAKIIGPDAMVGGNKNGPWFPVTDIGLFAADKTPLPHPAGTHVADYQVRGMSSALPGPFKLRELIEFAARGLLPADALVKSDDSDEWVRARRYTVIAACLKGELVLPDGHGNAVSPGRVLAKSPPAADVDDQAGGSIDVAKHADDKESANSPPQQPTIQPTEKDKNKKDSKPRRAPSIRVPSKQLSAGRATTSTGGLLARLTQPRVAIPVTCALLLFVGVASAFSFWNRPSMQRQDAIGNWVGMSSNYGEPSFGLSLRDDGQCIYFNMQGESWSGDFDWANSSDSNVDTTQTAAEATAGGQGNAKTTPGPIMPADGHIIFRGSANELPSFNGQSVRELFLRREDELLRIGYPASQAGTTGTESSQANWMTATKLQDFRPDVGGKLQNMAQEDPVPTAGFGGKQPMHISKAIDAVYEGVNTSSAGTGAIAHETPVYSNSVNARYLLRHFGVPDEARSVSLTEVAGLRGGPTLEVAQLVRYENLKFYLSRDGELRYLALVAEPIL